MTAHTVGRPRCFNPPLCCMCGPDVRSDHGCCLHGEISQKDADHLRGPLTFDVLWSAEDQQWVGTCQQFPSLSSLADVHGAAVEGIVELAYATRDDLDRGAAT